jgi:RNA polymerase sigma-70 factor (family 1)
MPVFSEVLDTELLEHLKNSDTDAFTEIYARYWKLIYYVAFKRLNNNNEAEETVQNIFMDLWERRSTLTIHTSLKYFLAAAAQYQVMNVLAKKHRVLNIEISDESVSSNTADSFINFRELQKQIEETVAALPERCRVVYQLSREEGLNNRAIAQKLGISEKTVENQLTKALSRLRTRLGNPAFLSFLL